MLAKATRWWQPYLFGTSARSMGLFDHFQSQHEEVHKEGHEGHHAHEAIAGAATYEAIKAYQEHCEKEGKPTDHATAKKVMGGLAAAALTRLIETKGLDYIDKVKAEKEVEKHGHAYIDETH
ncbi:hypothetical protein O0I10_004284 [Lichtheimia ornata]|uniref:Uncharacterized protein n=1 Tax=Lichtheimia ornata TaxID=688661 RepID=A0AAD7V9I1_9FUNG|nr:uncharacterized protein O0I10_004284 [Lichtheimia ornata]KAJ8660056.1 hypothetical protein O0I10_004284 [Lichtheimia ornata]